jgi:exodeoxyribonuclease VII small subunit
MEQQLETLSFEEALSLLEEAVRQLEEGDLNLEEALTIFERGQALAQYCSQKLESASLRVEQLMADGEITEIAVE